MSCITSLPCPVDSCHINEICATEGQNKVIGAALVRKSAAGDIDKSTPALWLQSIFQAFLDGNATLILQTSGDKPAPDTAELVGRGMQPTRPGSKNHTLNLVDFSILKNVQFYNDILQTSQNFDLYYFTPSYVWDASGNYISVIGDPVITDDLNTYIQGAVVMKWNNRNNPVPCSFDTDEFLQGLFYTIANADFPNFEFVYTEGAVGPTIFTASLNQYLSDTDLVWSIEGTDADNVDLGATMASDTGTLSFSGSIAGTYSLIIHVTNQAGCVFGEQAITITVEAA